MIEIRRNLIASTVQVFLARLVLTLSSICLVMPALAAGTLIVEKSHIDESWFGGLSLSLALSEPVPASVRYLDNPYRVILEFKDLQPIDFSEDFWTHIDDIERLNFGSVSGGARLVMTFDQPYFVEKMQISRTAVEGGAGVFLELESLSPEDFALKTEGLRYQGIDMGFEPPKVTGAETLPLILLDAGHGGVDPGAERVGVREKDITLFAVSILANALLSTDRYRVALTREDDTFISLSNRRRMAEQIKADLFLSIHADTVEIGDARGTTIYSLAENATSEVAAKFALYENRVDLFAGEFLEGEQADLGHVLTQMAQKVTLAKADEVAASLQEAWVSINENIEESRRESAAFAVLKAPEVPSLLLEIGYLTNADDRDKIRNKDWLEKMAAQLIVALDEVYYPELSASK